MSEKDENNENQNAEIIESEIVEAPDLTDEMDQNAPVVIKKGGFVSFLAFLLAASSMTVSVYLYMQLQNKDKNITNVNAWQEPMTAAEKKADQKFKQLANQISQIQQTNVDLQTQLGKVEQIAANLPSNGESDEATSYDDSQMVQQYQSLLEQLTIQNNALTALKTTVTNNKQLQIQSTQQLNQKLSNPDTQPNNQMRITQDFRYEMAESYLQETHKQLNIYGNVDKGLEFLSKTLEQLSVLEGIEYQNLKSTLQKVSDEITQKPTFEIHKINKQIDQLVLLTAALSQNQTLKPKDASQNDEKESSWYDKLIVIRKVDEKNETKLTSDEKDKIFQDLDNHFNMMKIALMNNKQQLWNNEIGIIESLLNQHFPSQSSPILNQLAELKIIEINPTFPDLSGNLETIQRLNKQKFSQTDVVPLESKLTVQPTTESKENQ